MMWCVMSRIINDLRAPSIRCCKLPVECNQGLAFYVIHYFLMIIHYYKKDNEANDCTQQIFLRFLT